MKKLMIVMALLVATVAANAASFKWTAGQIYGSDGTSLWGGSVSLYCDGAVVDTATASSGNVVNKTFSMDATTDKTYYFTVVIEDNGKKFTSAAVSAVAQEAATSPIGFGSLKTATQSAGSWETVPEPTTAMLMVLGIAGLALRRRRV